MKIMKWEKADWDPKVDPGPHGRASSGENYCVSLPPRSAARSSRDTWLGLGQAPFKAFRESEAIGNLAWCGIGMPCLALACRALALACLALALRWHVLFWPCLALALACLALALACLALACLALPWHWHCKACRE